MESSGKARGVIMTSSAAIHTLDSSRMMWTFEPVERIQKCAESQALSSDAIPKCCIDMSHVLQKLCHLHSDFSSNPHNLTAHCWKLTPRAATRSATPPGSPHLAHATPHRWSQQLGW